MNILVFGRGAIGTQYGWALENAGHKVDFFVRKGRIKDYGNTVSLDIYDTRSKKQTKENWQINLKEEIEEDKTYDLILLSVNPEQVEGALLQVKRFAKNTTVLFFCNYGLEVKAAVKDFPADQIVFGFPGAGGGYEGNTLGGIMYNFFQLGQAGAKLSERESFVKKYFLMPDLRSKFRKTLKSGF